MLSSNSVKLAAILARMNERRTYQGDVMADLIAMTEDRISDLEGLIDAEAHFDYPDEDQVEKWQAEIATRQYILARLESKRGF